MGETMLKMQVTWQVYACELDNWWKCGCHPPNAGDLAGLYGVQGPRVRNGGLSGDSRSSVSRGSFYQQMLSGHVIVFVS